MRSFEIDSSNKLFLIQLQSNNENHQNPLLFISEKIEKNDIKNIILDFGFKKKGLLFLQVVSYTSNYLQKFGGEVVIVSCYDDHSTSPFNLIPKSIKTFKSLDLAKQYFACRHSRFSRCLQKDLIDNFEYLNFLIRECSEKNIPIKPIVIPHSELDESVRRDLLLKSNDMIRFLEKEVEDSRKIGLYTNSYKKNYNGFLSIEYIGHIRLLSALVFLSTFLEESNPYIRRSRNIIMSLRSEDLELTEWISDKTRFILESIIEGLLSTKESLLERCNLSVNKIMHEYNHKHLVNVGLSNIELKIMAVDLIEEISKIEDIYFAKSNLFHINIHPIIPPSSNLL